MFKEKFLIVGHGAREAAFASKIGEKVRLYAYCGHRNPTIDDRCRHSGGELAIGSVEDGEAIADFARRRRIDYALVNADGPLSHGVVDQLMAAGCKTIGPTREGSQIEWDKVYSMRLMAEIFPKYCPRFEVVENLAQAPAAVENFVHSGLDVVVKPQGLTGGKGVKVMGEHLADVDAVLAYIHKLFTTDPNTSVLLVEKLSGIEFTMMGLTDGHTLIPMPVTYDYPYRYAGDRGPGTGGMGCFTDSRQPAFFLSESAVQACTEILSGVVDWLRTRNKHFSGFLNGGFFVTSAGLRFMEFNARIGDPEGVNLLSLMQTPLAELLKLVHHRRLQDHSCRLSPNASVVKYLVSPSYPSESEAIEFKHDARAFAQEGIETYYGACISKGNGFQSISSSRLVALCAKNHSIEAASDQLNAALERYADKRLDYRADIGASPDLKKLSARSAQLQK